MNTWMNEKWMNYALKDKDPAFKHMCELVHFSSPVSSDC